VSIGSVDGGAVAEAERQIKLVLNPPTAEVGQTYPGKVVNITKFGAFVNILPGRDGLLHISKLGGGKRIDKVEDVLALGDDVMVKVDDVDPNGQVSLSPVDALTEKEGAGGGSDRGDRGSDRGERGGRDRDRGSRSSESSGDADEGNGSDNGSSNREYVSFEDTFADEAKAEYGDLGPEREEASRSGGGEGGGGRRRRRR
jgi:polyribonucleotide nucleotidyltransferase